MIALQWLRDWLLERRIFDCFRPLIDHQISFAVDVMDRALLVFGVNSAEFKNASSLVDRLVAKRQQLARMKGRGE